MSLQSGTPSDSRSESHWAAYDAAGIQTLLAVEDRHFWFRARNQIIRSLVSPPIQELAPGFRILEVGCGSGNVLRVLKSSAAGRGWVEGLEVSAAAAEVAHQRTGLTITNGHLADLAAPEPYDIIAAFDVLEHIRDDAGVLSQMRERLKELGSVDPYRARASGALERVRCRVGTHAQVYTGEHHSRLAHRRVRHRVPQLFHGASVPGHVVASPVPQE